MGKNEVLPREQRLAVVLLSLLAAAIHVALVPEHYEEWWGYGGFFVVSGALQALYALWWLMPRPGWPGAQATIVVGIALNLFLVGLYVVTRTAGVPWFGPHAWETEPVSAVDLVAKGAEVLLLFVLLDAWRASQSRLSRIHG